MWSLHNSRHIPTAQAKKKERNKSNINRTIILPTQNIYINKHKKRNTGTLLLWLKGRDENCSPAMDGWMRGA
jgi:hypothetical protein